MIYIDFDRGEINNLPLLYVKFEEEKGGLVWNYPVTSAPRWRDSPIVFYYMASPTMELAVGSKEDLLKLVLMYQLVPLGTTGAGLYH